MYIIYIVRIYKCPYKWVTGVVNLLIGAPFTPWIYRWIPGLWRRRWRLCGWWPWHRQRAGLGGQGTRGSERGSSSNQWLFLVPLKGGIGSIFHPPEGKDYKWYISGIYCQLGDYMLPIPPFRGTRNNHWSNISNPWLFSGGKLASFQKWVVITRKNQ